MDVSTSEISFGGGSVLFSWDLLNEQPRIYRCSATFSVSNKLKKKTRKRKAKEEPGEGIEANGSQKKRERLGTQEDVDTSVNLRSTSRVPSVGEHWEVDSGFSSEASPPNSGRCSPCVAAGCSARVVAVDCEMVGTGPGGRRSELARCSVLNYDGEVLYDQYIRPERPVTNYRTQWSGIRKEHLNHAVPFKKARSQIAAVLKDKVVIGHALHNDFKALQFSHPRHLIRDTSSSRALKLLVGEGSTHGCSLKSLSQRLLSRHIQVGKAGHCSVEDAQAALDLYKLVEQRWEQLCAEADSKDPQPQPFPFPSPTPAPNPEAALSKYMSDQYWPDHMDCSQP
ncbi:apoptosis-enhancing nuclease [Engraulis encrasicolus]|uniref:apoptosis-enhancing nuclease n=1 Tax=Engraulis encrasicolus TaxID=184585 RepID=UPI002FCF4F7D